MSSMNTNLAGRLRNTNLPYSHGLAPLFEAVVNSIHAIDEAKLSLGDGRITVEIVRDKQESLKPEEKSPGREPTPDILNFKITDNGIGFDEKNMTSFMTLDSDHKAHIGGRGVGRLLWLKAFDSVSVESVYLGDDGDLKRRKFQFNEQTGVSSEDPKSAAEGSVRSTIVQLSYFKARYRDASRKQTDIIARNILEHCLWYFIRPGGAPQITVHDEENTIRLDDLYEEVIHADATSKTITIKGEEFDLTHVRLESMISKKHYVAYGADSRLVLEEHLRGKIPGLFGALKDDEGEFIYACYVASKFLDSHVRSERTEFDIPEESLGLLEGVELTWPKIQEGVRKEIVEHLQDYLDENKKQGKARVEEFVAQKAPRYRPILKHIPEDDLAVDPEMSDKDLDMTLHRHLSDIENKMLEEGHDIMHPKKEENFPDYKRRVAEYLKRAGELKQSDLANYVSHRKVILDLLAVAVQRKDDGTYNREDIIHNLIMPMGEDSNGVMFESTNLWIIDESLAFHDYLASDKQIRKMPISDSEDQKEPDIVALNVYDNPMLVAEGERLPLAAIQVVEIKKPMRNDAQEGEEKDPIEQALGYLKRIRKGEVTTATGRPIPQSDSIPGFCYVLADLTPKVKERCLIHDAIRTSDGLGYFFYHKGLNAYVEIISFDRLVNLAKERNRAFFDKLGLPTN
ncbi:ATP-binding protein [bacterium]|nr:ATP-binding protein [bacterium]